MRRLLKLLMLSVLIIAIPFKGVAMASVALWEPAHDHSSQRGAHDGEHDHTHAHHAVAGHSANTLTDMADVASANEHPASVNDKIPCTGCGAHAIAASLDTAPASVRASSLFIPFLRAMYVGIFRDGLERPPKAIFA